MEGLSHETVHAICQDKRGFLWIGTDDGLNRYDGYQFKVFKNIPFDSNSIGSNHINVLHEDQYGAIWVGTDKGLSRYDPRTGLFTGFRCNPDSRQGLYPGIITAIASDDAERSADSQVVWIGTDKGLNRLTLHSPRDSHPNGTIIRMAGDPISAKGGAIRNMIVDGRGLLWVSTDEAVYSCDPASKPNGLLPFKKQFACSGASCSFMLDPDHSLWIISNKSIVKVPQDGAVRLQFQEFTFPHGARLNNTHNVALDWRRKIFVILHGETPLGFDTRSGVFKPLANHYSQFAKTFNCSQVFCDRGRNIWFGTSDGGLLKYHLKNDYFNRLSDLEKAAITRHLHSPNFGQGIIDRKGQLWYPHEDGLACINPENSNTKIYGHDPQDTNSLSHNQVNVVLADPVYPERYLWVGTEGGGINRLDRQTNRFVHYTEKDGLPSAIVTGILPDDKGRLWISTARGITRLELNTARELVYCKNYGRQEGLPGAGFSVNASYKTQEGHLYFGGSGGWISFHPDSLSNNQPPPPLAITDFFIHHRSVSHGEPGSPLQNPISETRELTLSPSQNTLGFAFAALDFSAPFENRYAYMLENFDTGWNVVGNRRQALYTDLPPGTYKLSVKACNSDGIWNEEATELVIVIQAHWWQHWWIYPALGILVVALLWKIALLERRQRRIQMNAAIEQARLKEKSRQAEHLEAQARKLAETFLVLKEKNEEVISIQQKLIAQDKLATLGQLIAGIAHEIKSPLNFVINFSEIAAEQADELAQLLDQVQGQLPAGYFGTLQQLTADIRLNALESLDGGRRATALIRNLMDLSRDSDDHFYETDLHAMLEENIKLAYHGFKALATDFKVEIEKSFNPELQPVDIIPADIGRVFLNILSNACYAIYQKQKDVGSGYQPLIQVSTAVMGDKVQIRIRDNGAGIRPEVKDRIFNPFFTTKPSGKGNAGLGLSISRNIVVDKHGGAIEVNSHPGAFTEFLITIPIKHNQS